MTAAPTAQIAGAFVKAINAHDLDALAMQMTSDHIFIDSLGNQVAGPATMLESWRAYFTMFPDYAIDLDNVLTAGPNAMLHGRAHGTLHRDGAAVVDGAWTVPAAWRAVVTGGRISLWQVYTDNNPVHDLLGRND